MRVLFWIEFIRDIFIYIQCLHQMFSKQKCKKAAILSLSRRCDFDRDSASSLSAQKLPYVEPHKF